MQMHSLHKGKTGEMTKASNINLESRQEEHSNETQFPNSSLI